MKKKKTTPFIGTHARLIISEWQTIADLITKHGQLIKNQTHLDDINIGEDEVEDADEDRASLNPSHHVVSRREIEDALNGPMQGFFKQKLTAYMKLSIIRLHFSRLEDDTLKDYRTELPEQDKVPNHILENITSSDLIEIQQALDDLTIQHAETWEQLRDQWKQQILQRLNEQNLALSEIEVKEFSDPEPISELLERFITLNIEPPKLRKTASSSSMNFSNYFTLKADIAIQSALSRQHLPHTQTDIQKILNQLKSDFNAIAKQELATIHTQKNETEKVVTDISW